MYDPAIGRFTGVDPISDKFAHVSTYNYAENEPIAHIDLWGLQKYKPKIQPINSPRDLFSTKMLNNIYEGAKTVTREIFTKDVGNALKTGGDVIEYGGITAGMTGHVEVSGAAVLTGKTMNAVGTGIIAIDEFIETGGVSVETVVDVSIDLLSGLLPEPLEKSIDGLGLDKATTTVFKSQRDAIVKSTTDVVKDGIKSLDKPSEKSQIVDNQNCTDQCNN